jgi:hypothetical protein
LVRDDGTTGFVSGGAEIGAQLGLAIAESGCELGRSPSKLRVNSAAALQIRLRNWLGAGEDLLRLGLRGFAGFEEATGGQEFGVE